MTLEHLDTLIAFAAVMAMVSLFITALTQMFSALIGLRGHNLRVGLQTMLESLDPALRDHAAAISEQVLLHPLISDSMLTRRDNFLAKSLPIRWLLESEATGPALKKFILPIANRWKLATTLRGDEFVDVLQKLAESLPVDAAWRDQIKKAAQAAQALELLTVGQWRKVPVETQAQALAGLVQTIAGLKPEWKEELENAQKVIAAFTAQNLDGPANLKTAARILHTLAALIHLDETLRQKGLQLTDEIDHWFDKTMTRVSQHFSMHTRLTTVTFAVIVALGLQLDALELLKRLSSDAELRTRLVSSAETLSKKADEMLVFSSSTNPPALICVEAMRQLKAKHTNTNELGRLPEPAGFTNIADGKQWLFEQFGRANPAAATNTALVKPWQDEFESLVPQAALRSAADNVVSLWKDQAKLGLIPDPYPKGVKAFLRSFWSHAVGIVASAVFLSLGAPFWFNALKSLTNLRPILANKQDKEAKATPAA